jgi:hypothetical protein
MQLVFILWIALITAITYGKDSPLFVFLWHHVPSFSQLRCWGRMNILLIPIIAWIVALGYARFEGLVFSGTPAARARVFRFLAGAFLLILGIQLFYVTRHFFHPYWADYFLGPKEEALARFVPPAFAPYGRLILAHLHLSFLIASILSFIVLAVMLRRRMSSPNRMLALCVIVACADLGVCGPWTWLARPASSERTVLNIPAVDARSFNTPRTNDYSTISLTSAFSVGIVENWYYARYLRFRGLYATDQRDTRQFLGMDDGKKLYFTRALAHADLRSFLNDAALSSAAMKVLFYDGNTLAIRVAAPRKGYVSFIDNWDPDWKAWIDGCPAEIELLFGAFKAVSVAEGKHTVVLSYRPFSNHNPYPSPS